MKILDGSELSGFIKERQSKQVRALRQSWKVFPKLAIIHTSDSPVVATYMRLKRQYGEDILIDVEFYHPAEDQLINQIKTLNSDDSVHGIIVQLPLSNPDQVEAALAVINPEKDVDGLTGKSSYVPATAMAINWLLVGYDIDLTDKKIAIVGKGRLVGAPLIELWKKQGLDVTVCDSKTTDLAGVLKLSDVIVAATGRPGLISSDMIKKGAVVVDAGTASEQGKIVGDVAMDVRERDDITITPIKGGVGPLTVAVLFDNVIAAARKIADQKGQQDL